jgi:TonB family protein
MLPAIALSLALLAMQASAQDAAPSDQPSPATTAPQSAAPTRRPCRNPDTSGNYHGGCGVTPPKALNFPEPEFSEEARRKKLGGVVGVVLTVDTDGNPTDVRVWQSLADKVDPKNRKAALSLDQQAIACVKQYKFAPATYQGKPVPIELHIEVNFQIF